MSDQQRYSGLLQMRLLFADVYRVSPSSLNSISQVMSGKLCNMRLRSAAILGATADEIVIC
ncbi:hypothetical protein J6590_103147 [Homalodisca vitripennis]|nr:hypothetical protein J6590_103147 [Homalodisca vitripennis]